MDHSASSRLKFHCARVFLEPFLSFLSHVGFLISFCQITPLIENFEIQQNTFKNWLRNEKKVSGLHYALMKYFRRGIMTVGKILVTMDDMPNNVEQDFEVFRVLRFSGF